MYFAVGRALLGRQMAMGEESRVGDVLKSIFRVQLHIYRSWRFVGEVIADECYLATPNAKKLRTPSSIRVIFFEIFIRKILFVWKFARLMF